MFLHSSYLTITNTLLKLHVDTHIKMNMCTYGGIHDSHVDFTLGMNPAAHSLPRHKIWAGYATASNTFLVSILQSFSSSAVSSGSNEDGDNKAC